MTDKAWVAIDGLAERTRKAKVKVDPSDSLVFHVEAQTVDDVAPLIAKLKNQFPKRATAKPLFKGTNDTTARFIELKFPDVDADLAAPVAYDAAYALADEHSEIKVVEPDLPTSFFFEPDEAPPGGPGAESAIVNMFCEVSGAPPADKHWAIKLIKADAAIIYSDSIGKPSGGKGILVAQPDTGIGDNAELEPGSIHPSGGWDIIDNKAGARDPQHKGNPGHGTATGSCVISRPAGVIQGSAPAATLYPIRAIESVVIFKAGPVAKAIERAIMAKAQVITMSLGGVPSAAVRAVIKRAREAGIIVLAAAGNCVGLVVWPARYPECLAVAGCNNGRMAWKGTSRGPAVDITAPGEQVWHASLKTATGYKDGQGTSFAVALTAGAAAQWLAHHGPAQVAKAAKARNVTVHDLFRAALQETAEPNPLLPTDAFGPGIVDVRALLELDLDKIGAVKPAVEREGDDPGDTMPEEYREIYAKFGGAKPENAKLDWRKYGAELGRVALRRAVSAEAEQASLPESSPAGSSAAVKTSVAVINDPALKSWLGIS